MAKKWTMPKNVGDNHPKVEEVREALNDHTKNLPEGVTINFGWGEAWLMDTEDADEMLASGFNPAKGFMPTDSTGETAAGGTFFAATEEADMEESGGADTGDNDTPNTRGTGTRAGRGAGSQAAGGGNSSTRGD
jgi:hypothetical protein